MTILDLKRGDRVFGKRKGSTDFEQFTIERIYIMTTEIVNCDPSERLRCHIWLRTEGDKVIELYSLQDKKLFLSPNENVKDNQVCGAYKADLINLLSAKFDVEIEFSSDGKMSLMLWQLTGKEPKRVDYAEVGGSISRLSLPDGMFHSPEMASAQNKICPTVNH